MGEPLAALLIAVGAIWLLLGTCGVVYAATYIRDYVRKNR